MSFSSSTTGEDVIKRYPDQLSGKTIIITGASVKGLGAQTAYALAHSNPPPAQFILLGRSPSKVQPVIDEIHKINSSIKSTFVPVELDDPNSVQIAASQIISHLGSSKLDILLNNAGIMAVPFSITKFGVESQFGTNHIGHFLLTQLLYPRFSKDTKVINLTSMGYTICGLQDDYNFANGAKYHEWMGYGQSKTSNILFTKALAKRGIISYSVHPGVILGTGLTAGMDLSWVNSPGMEKPRSIESGCSTSTFACVAPGLKNGSFLRDCAESGFVKPWANDEKDVERLWKISEEITGTKWNV